METPSPPIPFTSGFSVDLWPPKSFGGTGRAPATSRSCRKCPSVYAQERVGPRFFETRYAVAGSHLRKKQTRGGTLGHFRRAPLGGNALPALLLSSTPSPASRRAQEPGSALSNRQRSAVSGHPRLSRGRQRPTIPAGVPSAVSGSAHACLGLRVRLVWGAVEGPPSRPESARLFPPGGGPGGLEPRRRRLTQRSRGCGDSGGSGGGDDGRNWVSRWRQRERELGVGAEPGSEPSLGWCSLRVGDRVS